MKREGRPCTVSQQVFETPKVARHVAVEERDSDTRIDRKPGTVEIIAIRESGAGAGDDKSPPKATRENYVPAKYSTNSTLTAEVEEDAVNVFDFSLTMQK
jgi:hypothetical protein